MSRTPLIKKGMLLRVSSSNMSWLIEPKFPPSDAFSPMDMVQVQKGAHLTVIDEMFMEKGSSFPRYPVLYKHKLLCLFEPSVNFHLDFGSIQIIEE